MSSRALRGRCPPPPLSDLAGKPSASNRHERTAQRPAGHPGHRSRGARRPTGRRQDREEQKADAERRCAQAWPGVGGIRATPGRFPDVVVHAGHDNELTTAPSVTRVRWVLRTDATLLCMMNSCPARRTPDLVICRKQGAGTFIGDAPPFLLADSRLPSGGHGHSGGVEALVDRGLCGRSTTSRSSSRAGCGGRPGRWPPRQLRPACSVPRRRGRQPVDWARWDAAVSARTPRPRCRTASGPQGAALLRTARRRPDPRCRGAAHTPAGHHPLVLGAAAAAAGADPGQAAALALHHLVGGAVHRRGAAARAGPAAGHRRHRGVARAADPVAADAAASRQRPSPRTTRAAPDQESPLLKSWPNCTAHRRRPSLHRDDP